MVKKYSHAKRRRRWRWLRTIVLLSIAGGGTAALVYHYRPALLDKPAESVTLDRFYSVERGEFNIAISLEGTLGAIKSHNIKCTFRGRFGLEVTEVVEDRTPVKEGDVLFRFSDQKYLEELEKKEEALEEEHKNLRLAEEDLQIIEATNLNMVKSAVDKLRSVRDQLTKYEELDAPRKKKELNAGIDAGRQKLAEARTALTDAKNELSRAAMQDQGKVAGLEKKVEGAAKAVEQAEDALEKAHYALRVFKQYDHPQKMRELREGLTKGRMGMQRELVDSSSTVIKARREIQHHMTRIKQMEKELQELKDSLDQLTIYSPADGIFSLGQPRRNPWQEVKEIKIGTAVSTGEVIGSIPDLSQFMVNTDVPEEYRSHVRTGLRATLRSKAIPDLLLNGEVKHIAPMATHVIHWDKNSPKIYPTVIHTDGTDERLMPGMTMRIELIVDEVKGALFVPVEGLYHREGATYCKVKTTGGVTEVEVETGRSSNSYVEILDGLQEGAEVLLHRAGVTPL